MSGVNLTFTYTRNTQVQFGGMVQLNSLPMLPKDRQNVTSMTTTFPHAVDKTLTIIGIHVSMVISMSLYPRGPTMGAVRSVCQLVLVKTLKQAPQG